MRYYLAIKGTIYWYTITDESQKSYAKLDKPAPKIYTLCVSIYITPYDVQNNKDRNQNRGQGWGEEGIGIKEWERTFGHDGNVLLHLGCDGGYMNVYICWNAP